MANEKRLLIEKEPIKKFIEAGLNNPDRKNAFGYDAIQILAEIEFAPTVDAVEVVRCKDCEFCVYNSCNDTYKCRSMSGMFRRVEPDEFCSYGERRNNA